MASAIFSESATESLIACPSSRSKAFKLSSSRKVVLLALIRFYGGSRKDTSTSAPTCHCTFGQPYVLEWGHERKWIFAFQSQLGFSALARRLGYVSRLLEARPPAFPRSRRDALALFALYAGAAAWKQSHQPDGQWIAAFALGYAVMMTWFSFSSFRSARRVR